MRKLLFFHATWCAPCKAAKQIISQIETACPNQVEQVDVDIRPSFTQRMRVTAIPASILMEDDKIIDKYVGKDLPTEKIIEWLKGSINDSDHSD